MYIIKYTPMYNYMSTRIYFIYNIYKIYFFVKRLTSILRI